MPSMGIPFTHSLAIDTFNGKQVIWNNSDFIAKLSYKILNKKKIIYTLCQYPFL